VFISFKEKLQTYRLQTFELYVVYNLIYNYSAELKKQTKKTLLFVINVNES